MKKTFKISVARYLEEAWDLFCKAPTLFLGLGILQAIPNIALSHLSFGVFSYVISALFCAGTFTLAKKIENEKTAKFSDLSAVVDFIPQIAIYGFVAAVIVTIGFFFFILPGIYLLVSYSVAVFLIVDKNKSFWQAMESSRELVGKNWFGMLGLSLVWFFLTISGLLLLGVGVVASAPIANLFFYRAYQNILTQQENPLLETLET